MAQKNQRNSSPYKKHLQGKKQERSRGHLKANRVFGLQEANDRLYDIFRNHGLDWVSHHQRLQLARYYRLLMEEQSRQNFTRILDFRDIAIKQFIDSILWTQFVEPKFPLLDLGSGPGLPGIPLKILYPEQKIFLAEGVQKRVAFLKQVREELELKNLGIFGRNINAQFLYPVQSVVSRAVEDISNSLENTKHCIQTGGCFYFLKGPRVDQELQNLNTHDFDLVLDQEYDLPKTPHKRRLLVFQKVRPTPLLDLEEWLDREYQDED